MQRQHEQQEDSWRAPETARASGHIAGSAAGASGDAFRQEIPVLLEPRQHLLPKAIRVHVADLATLVAELCGHQTANDGHFGDEIRPDFGQLIARRGGFLV